jgi:gliding motility-associated-like protein
MMKSKLLFRLLFCLAVLFSGLGVQTARATHFAAGDIQVTFIGNDSTDLRYLVQYFVYKVCERLDPNNPNSGMNALLGQNETITVSSINAGVNISHSRKWDSIGVNADGSAKYLDTLDQLCGNLKSQNSCFNLQNDNKYPAFVRARYSDTINLSSYPRATDWTFVWTNGARNAAILNVTPNQGNIWVEARINNLAKYNVSTARYSIDPTPYMCVNQPFRFGNAPIDPVNFDKLRTYNFLPQHAGGASMGYLPGYSLTNPMASTTGYYVDSMNGNAYFTPGTLGKFVIKFRTYTYDKFTNQEIAYTSRDVQVIVLPCSSLPPVIDTAVRNLTGATQITGSIISACPGVAMSFDLKANSSNPGNKVFIRPIGILPGGVGFSQVPNTAGDTSTANVTWTPAYTDIGDHLVVLEAVDSTCDATQPLVLKSNAIITIRVLPGIDAGPDIKVCPLGERPAQLHVAGPVTSNYYWYKAAPGDPTAEYLSCTNCQDPLAAPEEPVYDYVVYSDDPFFVCKSRDTVTVYHDTSVQVIAPQDLLVVCRPGYVNLQATTVGLAPLANLFCGTADPVQCLAQDQDTVTIGGGTNPSPQVRNSPFYSGYRYHKYQYIIPKQDLLNAGLYSGTINSMAFLHINPTVVGTEPLENITISLACVPFDKFPTPATNADFYNATPVATLASYTLTANDWNQINFATPYSWDTTTNLLVDICVGPLTTPNTGGGADPFAMTAGPVIQKYDDNINICGGNGTVYSYNQRPVTRFMYCPSPELPFNFTWTPGTFLNDSNVQNPVAYIPRSVDYAVYTIGRNGCRIRDYLHVVVPDHHVDRGPVDSVTCRDQPVPLWATGGDAYQWFEVANDAFIDASGSLNCTNCANPIATPASTTKYAVVFTNDVNRGNPLNEGSDLGCPDTLFTTVFINPLPPVRSSNKDTIIAYGKRVQLFATGASNFTWTPVGSLDNPNSPAPWAMPKETTNYIVSGMDSNGCVYRDTVKVIVDYKANLLIPSAFTPNGDGRNDVFRVVNPSFQRLMEFRVFNRWGQEVFTTTDIFDGWDGKWKGVEQAIGNYQYLIRVAYPDGNTETYKGDINLIR